MSLAKGIISLGLSDTDGESTFSLSVNPAGNLNDGKTPEARAQNRADRAQKHPFGGRILNTVERAGRLTHLTLIGGNHGFFTFSEMNRATQVTAYHGGAVNISAGFQVNPLPLPAGVTTNLSGSYSWQENEPRDPLKAYGYMYAANTTGDDAIQDYYVEKETPYNKACAE